MNDARLAEVKRNELCQIMAEVMVHGREPPDCQECRPVRKRQGRKRRRRKRGREEREGEIGLWRWEKTERAG